jgi:non-ribosomal peptide synthetase component F
VLDAGLATELRALGRRYGVTLFMTLLAGFKALIHHVSGASDIVVGTDVANRNQLETELLIGFFVNQLVLRTSLSGDPTFAELLARARETSLEAYAHEDVPFDRLVDALQGDRSLAQTPLFQVKLVLQNAPFPNRGPAGLCLRPFEVGWETAKFDLLLNMLDTGDTLEGLWEYSTDLFGAATIVVLQESLEAILRLAAARPDARLSEISQALAQGDSERRAGTRGERFQANQGKLRLVRRRPHIGSGRGETP